MQLAMKRPSASQVVSVKGNVPISRLCWSFVLDTTVIISYRHLLQFLIAL